MQMSASEKQAFVNALDRAKRTVHPDLVICVRRYIHVLTVHNSNSSSVVLIIIKVILTDS